MGKAACVALFASLALSGCGTIATPAAPSAQVGKVRETNVETLPTCHGQKTYSNVLS
jgi:uncharacterized protein YceK